MKRYKAVAYRSDDGQYAIVIYNGSNNPIKISGILDVVSIEGKSSKLCNAKGCQYYKYRDYDFCKGHAIKAYGSVIDDVRVEEWDRNSS